MTSTVDAPSDHTTATALAPIDRRIFVIAGGLFALLMACSGRFGFHRDELYFLDCARHLSASYVDQPIFTPLVARLSLELFGVSLVGLRLWSALAALATVIIGGLLAREFGGGRTAQLIGALGVATAPAVLGADHLLETTSFDLLAWAGLALVIVRIGRTGDTRLFVPAGLILGVGLSNKHSIAFFALALVVGIVLSGGTRMLLNCHVLIGLVIAVVCTVPDVWWQAAHGWPTIDMTRALARDNGGIANVPGFVLQQLVMASPVLIGVWLSGIRFLWRSENPLWRSLAWSYGLLIVFFAATAGAKPYYVAGMYFFLIAAGAVNLERRLAERGGGLRGLFAGLAVSVIVVSLFTLPVLPARIGGNFSIDPVPAETIGWPQLVHTVAGVWHGLSSEQRASAVIVTGNYGEAGAINELGRSDGLPQAVSGHNSEWFWGPGDPHATIVVTVVPARPADGVRNFVRMLHQDFAHVRVAASLHNGIGVTNQEQGGHVYICTGPVRSWGRLWPSLKHFE
jgi:4-amino-4-deoxy-L-arabinose transferase-like glycosyltransferase